MTKVKLRESNSTRYNNDRIDIKDAFEYLVIIFDDVTCDKQH